MKECYDGYHFVEDSEGIYNPFSVLNTFYKMKFGSYWFETGTPTYLVELLKKHHYDLERMAHEETSAVQGKPWVRPEEALGISGFRLDPAPRASDTRSAHFYSWAEDCGVHAERSL